MGLPVAAVKRYSRKSSMKRLICPTRARIARTCQMLTSSASTVRWNPGRMRLDRRMVCFSHRLTIVIHGFSERSQSVRRPNATYNRQTGRKTLRTGSDGDREWVQSDGHRSETESAPVRCHAIDRYDGDLLLLFSCYRRAVGTELQGSLLLVS